MIRLKGGQSDNLCTKEIPDLILIILEDEGTRTSSTVTILDVSTDQSPHKQITKNRLTSQA